MWLGMVTHMRLLQKLCGNETKREVYFSAKDSDIEAHDGCLKSSKKMCSIKKSVWT